MMTVPSLTKQVLNEYHVEGKRDLKKKSRPSFKGEFD
jgi:hypothetical protein